MGELVLNRKGQYGGKLGEITKTQGDTKPIFMEYYGNSDLINWGYWYEDTKDQKEACGNLMEELLAFIPKKTGNILDVASENSSSSHYLLKYFKPEKITGISTSGTQLEIYKKKSPGSKFLLMEPTNLDFKEASFANVICVEGAPRFRTRNKFIEEAYRVLKPRGKLILTDIMANQNIFKEGTQFPKENYLENIESYRSLLKKIGFRKVEIRDALHSCWKGMYYNFMRFLKKKTEERELRFFASKIINNKLFIFDQNLSGYLLIVAEKPE